MRLFHRKNKKGYKGRQELTYKSLPILDFSYHINKDMRMTVYWLIRTIIYSATFTKSQRQFKAPGNRNANMCSHVISDRCADCVPISTMKGIQDMLSPVLLRHEVCFHATQSSSFFAVSHWVNKHCLSGTSQQRCLGQILPTISSNSKNGYLLCKQCPKQSLVACHQG